MNALHASKWLLRTLIITLVTASLAAVAFARGDDDDDDDKDKPHPAHRIAPKIYDFSGVGVGGGGVAAPVTAEMLGATPGGAQDISFFRDRVAAGEIPHPRVFTPEGLFSEHDLPIGANARCSALFCVVGEAMDARLLVQSEVRYLAQLGFTSGLSAKDWKRPPLNLVAVVDKSGSMSGPPLQLVKESLLRVLEQMRPDDQLAIVLYGDRSHVYLAPTSAREKRKIARAIQKIRSAGSTNMENGLQVGFGLAEESARSFDGKTRVMLFTDERPNVGRTDAKSFMGMAKAASRKGVGMTTIGVGVQFGAELATKISSVRGGNLFFFPDSAKMKTVFTEDFDTMVTELAWDMKLVIRPARGLKIAGVYGIPGEALKWTKDGSIEMEVATLFLSKRKGAIYVAFGSAGAANLPEARVADGRPVGSVELSFTDAATGRTLESAVRLGKVPVPKAGTGLHRGLLLVNEATALKKATGLHHEKNDQEGAYQIVHALASTFRGSPDPDLAEERKMVFDLERTLAKLSGHSSEPSVAEGGLDPVTGLPHAQGAPR